MRYEIRPIGQWPGPRTPAYARRGDHQFRAAWNDTLQLLGQETDNLGARLVVLQVDVVAVGEIRRDGMLRANARVLFPGVRVSFDSKHGPLTYATDTYTSWQANVRAIALALQALRAVDRYGVTESGEQYRGWSAIEAGTGQPMTADRAVQLLVTFGAGTPAEVRHSPEARRRAYRAAVRKHHPDVGGEPDVFREVTQARDLLDELEHTRTRGQT